MAHPEHPQQLHLDIDVGDLDAAERLVLRRGATRLRDNGEFRVFSDAFGHAFCLYEAGGSSPARIARIVFDCFSPRALARFYDQLLDMPVREVDTPMRVVIARADGRGPMLGFQHAQFVAVRWPDPAYPEQIHLDLGFDDVEAGQALAERLGAIRLRPDGAAYADPAAHPFCLGGTEEPDPSWTRHPPTMARRPDRLSLTAVRHRDGDGRRQP